MEVTQIRVSDVVVGRRYRREAEDIEELAASLCGVGLIHPITVTTGGRLIAGHRRLLAARQLGWKEILATVVNHFEDAIKLLMIERDENTCRREFKPSEAIELGMALETLEREAAKKRQQIHGNTAPGRNIDGNLPQVFKGATRDKVGEAIGLSGKTYEYGEAVLAAAKADPERLGILVEVMDKRGVHPAYRELQALESPPQLLRDLDTPPGDYRDVVGELVDNLAWALVRSAPGSEALRDGRGEWPQDKWAVIEGLEALVRLVRQPKKPRLEVVGNLQKPG